MRKNFIFWTLMVVIIAIGFVSCNQQDVFNEEGIDLSSVEILKKEQTIQSKVFTLRASYKGKKYEVLCSSVQKNDLLGDSIIFLDNPSFKELYENEISHLPNLSTFVNEDGSIEYFDSNENLCKAKNISMEGLKNVVTAANDIPIGQVGTVQLFDDTNYRDTKKEWSITLYTMASETYIDYFNDKCSSMKVFYEITDSRYKVTFTGWENDNYSGRTIVVSANSTQSQNFLPNLKNIPCPPTGDWNDRITSFKFVASIL